MSESEYFKRFGLVTDRFKWSNDEVVRNLIFKLTNTCDWQTMLKDALRCLDGSGTAVANMLEHSKWLKMEPYYQYKVFHDIWNNGRTRVIGQALMEDPNCLVMRNIFAESDCAYMFFTETQYNLIKAQQTGSHDEKRLSKLVELENTLTKLHSEFSSDKMEEYKNIIELLTDHLRKLEERMKLLKSFK